MEHGLGWGEGCGGKRRRGEGRGEGGGDETGGTVEMTEEGGEVRWLETTYERAVLPWLLGWVGLTPEHQRRSCWLSLAG
jgi:hypothetical protein